MSDANLDDLRKSIKETQNQVANLVVLVDNLVATINSKIRKLEDVENNMNKLSKKVNSAYILVPGALGIRQNKKKIEFDE